jgi:hypothetical protein
MQQYYKFTFNPCVGVHKVGANLGMKPTIAKEGVCILAINDLLGNAIDQHRPWAMVAKSSFCQTAAAASQITCVGATVFPYSWSTSMCCLDMAGKIAISKLFA